MPLEHLPWVDSAGQILGLLALATLAALWLRATRHLRRGDVLDRFLDGFLLLAWIGVVAFWGLAALGWFRLVPALALPAAAAVCARWVLPRHRVGEAQTTPPIPLPARRVRLLLWVVAAPWALLAAARLVKALVAPPMGWDALTYHLPRAAIWVQSGSSALPGFPDAWSYYAWFPAGSDILLAWMMLPTRSDLVVGPFSFLVWLTVLMALRRLAALAGAETETAWLVALAVGTLPCVFSFATSSYADNPLLVFSLLAAAHGVDFLRSGRPAAAGYAAAAAGLAAAVKVSGVLIAVVVLAALAFKLATSRVPRRILLAASIVVLAALPAVGYGRAWLFRGSPLYPARAPLVDSLPFHQGFDLVHSGRILSEHEAHDRSAADLAALFWTDGRANGHLNLGLGGLVLALLAAAGILRGLMQGRRRDLAIVALGFSLSTLPVLTGHGVAALRSVWLDVIGRLLVPGWSPALVCAVLLPQWVAVPGLAGAAVLNLVHARPLGFSPALTAASLTAAMALMAAGVAAFGVAALERRVRGRSTCVLPAIVACLVLVPLVNTLRDATRLEAWRETGQGGSAFDAHALNPVFPGLVDILEHLDDGTSKRLAVTAGWDGTGHNQFVYPLMGSRLEHTLVYLPITGRGNDADLLPDERWTRRDEKAWLARLAAADVDYIVGLWPRPAEWDWVEAHPERLEVLDLDRGGFYRLARVK